MSKTNPEQISALRRLFTPGPLDWLLHLQPPRRRFHPGPHMHGLDRDDERLRPPSRLPRRG
jgi:hypothetical protein